MDNVQDGGITLVFLLVICLMAALAAKGCDSMQGEPKLDNSCFITTATR